MIKDLTVSRQQKIFRFAFDTQKTMHRAFEGFVTLRPRDRELGEVLLQHLLGLVTADAKNVEAGTRQLVIQDFEFRHLFTAGTTVGAPEFEESKVGCVVAESMGLSFQVSERDVGNRAAGFERRVIGAGVRILES